MSGREAIITREVRKLEAQTRQRPHFSTLATIDGYEVVDDRTGRPVGRRDTLASANGVCYVLNNAASAGPEALVRALGGSRKK